MMPHAQNLSERERSSRRGSGDRVRGEPSPDKARPSPGQRLPASLDLSLGERWAAMGITLIDDKDGTTTWEVAR